MIESLFSVFMSKIADSAIGWGTGKVLDVVTRCYKCEEPTETKLANVQTNHLECPNCNAHATQFTHACPATIQPVTLQIGHAAAGFVDRPFNRVNTWFRGIQLVIPYRIQLQGLTRRTVRIDYKLTDGSRQLHGTSVLAPASDSQIFDLKWKIDEGSLKGKTKNKATKDDCNCAACQRERRHSHPFQEISNFELTIVTETREELCKHLRYITPFKESS